MTRHALRAALQAASLPADLTDASALLRAVEAAADARPRDRAVTRALLAVHAWATAGDGLPSDVAGVRREQLVRWDAFSSTWDGVDLATGRPARVRVLRAAAARDPVLRRALHREGGVLQRLVPGLERVDGAWPALVAFHPGPPLSPAADPGEREDPSVLVRLVGTGLVSLARWEASGACPAPLADAEVHDAPDGLHVLCLTRADDMDGGARVARLAGLLLHWWDDGVETPIDPFLEGVCAFPPRSVAEATSLWRAALRDHLTETWHDLRRRRRAVAADDRRARFAHALTRLAHAVPPPAGLGLVGVDLEGRALVIEGRDGVLSWGPVDEPLSPVYTPDTGVDARPARRLLRTRAAAPPNRRLIAQVGGDEAFSEAACRWLSTRLQLRTLRMLVDRS